jgi:hypothetical protein
VVYSAQGPSILATVKPFSRPGMRESMRGWEETFGKGFAAAEVRYRGGRWVYVGLGDAEWEAEGQTASVQQASGKRPANVQHEENPPEPPEEAPPAVGGQLMLVETRTQSESRRGDPTLFDTGKD